MTHSQIHMSSLQQARHAQMTQHHPGLHILVHTMNLLDGARGSQLCLCAEEQHAREAEANEQAGLWNTFPTIGANIVILVAHTWVGHKGMSVKEINASEKCIIFLYYLYSFTAVPSIDSAC
jgi:hypothetical protein